MLGSHQRTKQKSPWAPRAHILVNKKLTNTKSQVYSTSGCDKSYREKHNREGDREWWEQLGGQERLCWEVVFYWEGRLWVLTLSGGRVITSGDTQMQRPWGLSHSRNNTEARAEYVRREVIGNEARERASKSSLGSRRKKKENPLGQANHLKFFLLKFLLGFASSWLQTWALAWPPSHLW